MKLLFLFLGIIAGQVISVAQNHAVDSLLISLKSAQNDTSRVKTLNVLSFEFRKQADNEKALQYATEALLKANDGLKQFSSIDKMGSQQIQGNKLLYALLKGKAASFNSIGFVYSGKGEYEMAIKSFSSALQIMEQSGNRKGLASSNSNIANIHKIQGHYDEALSYYLKSLDISEHAGDKAGVAGTCISIGDIHASKGDYEKALGFHLKAVKLVPTGTEYTLQWKRIAADAFMNLGNVDYYKSDFDNALAYYLKALNIQKELGNQKRLGDCYNNAANIYYIKNNYDKALEFYYEALKIMEETHSTQGLAYCYNNIGNIYLSKKDDVKALPFFTQSLELMIKIDDKQGAGVCYGNIAMVYLRTNKKAQAKEYQLKSLAIAKEIGAKEDISTAFLGLASADSALGNYKDAFSHYKLYTLYKDSIHNSESEKKMMQAVMQHEYDKKEALARAEQEKIESAHKATLAQQTMQRNAFIAGFILMLSLTAVSYRSFRNKRKANRQLEEKNHLIEEKQKEILDSIKYARRLQEAILPPINQVKEYLPDSFILHKPKDIIAGDFYWMHVINDGMSKMDSFPVGGERETILLAAADCTGHGVPGALVSVVCSNALNRTVKEFGITEPGQLLNKVRELVIETFVHSDSSGDKSEVKDGMDISLIRLNLKTKELQWAGANNPLWVVNYQKELAEVKPDKQSIGFSHDQKPFTTHTMQLREGDVVYLFTDGYADQFGGKKGKKLKYTKMKELLLSIYHADMEEQKKVLDETFEAWKDKLEQVDDVCVVGIRV